MTGPSESKKTAQRATRSSWLRYDAALPIARFLFYLLAMLGVRFSLCHVGLFGGLLTISGIFIASRWYD
jgi:hypothetical protein